MLSWEAVDFSPVPNNGLREYSVSVDGDKHYVSDKADENYQEYAILHETFCPQSGQHISGPKTCCDLEKAIVQEVVPIELKLQYVRRRISMLKSVIGLYGTGYEHYHSFKDTLNMLLAEEGSIAKMSHK